MVSVGLVLLALAVVCFLVAAFGTGINWNRWTAGGLALLALSMLVR